MQYEKPCAIVTGLMATSVQSGVSKGAPNCRDGGPPNSTSNGAYEVDE